MMLGATQMQTPGQASGAAMGFALPRSAPERDAQPASGLNAALGSAFTTSGHQQHLHMQQDVPVTSRDSRMPSSPASRVRDEAFHAAHMPELQGASCEDVESGDSFRKALLEMGEMDVSMEGLLRNLRNLQKNSNVGKFGKYYVANFMFLMILLGIEMDMAGFFMSLETYWKYDNPILKALVIFFTVSFIAPLAIQTYMGMDVEGAMDNTSAGHRPGVQVRRKDGLSGFMSDLLTRVKAISPHGGRMELYHWVPGVRFYLLVKESYDITDVDNIFKVNSISSFTLGIYQILGILATVVMNKELNVYVTVNIISQVLNWGITFLYYTTSISKWMGRAASARTLSRHFDGIANAYAKELADRSAHVMNTNKDEKEQCRKRAADFKASVAYFVLDQFFGPDEGYKGDDRCQNLDADNRKIAASIMKGMRDQDLKHFIVLLRNQAMAIIDMQGGV